MERIARFQRLGRLGLGRKLSVRKSFKSLRIGGWIQFQKMDGDGPDEGWLQYYCKGKRAATRTSANDTSPNNLYSNLLVPGW